MVAVVTSTEQGSENTEQGNKDASGSDIEQKDAIGNSKPSEEYSSGAQGILAEDDDEEHVEGDDENEDNVQSLKKELSKIIITTPITHHR